MNIFQFHGFSILSDQSFGFVQVMAQISDIVAPERISEPILCVRHDISEAGFYVLFLISGKSHGPAYTHIIQRRLGVVQGQNYRATEVENVFGEIGIGGQLFHMRGPVGYHYICLSPGPHSVIHDPVWAEV